MSYLIIEKMKLVVEIANIEDIESYEKKAIDQIVKNEDGEDFDIDIEDTEINDLSFREAVVLYNALDIVKSIEGINVDKMLFYWLNNRNFEYSIEVDIDLSGYQRDGYVILEKEE